MNAREKILRYAKIEPAAGGGERFIVGNSEHRSTKRLDEMTDAECQRLLDEGYLDIDGHIKQKEAQQEQWTKNLKNARKKTATVKVDAKPCECECGGMAKPGRKFLPGHDMKLKSRLRKAAKEGCADSLEELKDRGWS